MLTEVCFQLDQLQFVGFAMERDSAKYIQIYYSIYDYEELGWFTDSYVGLMNIARS